MSDTLTPEEAKDLLPAGDTIPAMIVAGLTEHPGQLTRVEAVAMIDAAETLHLGETPAYPLEVMDARLRVTFLAIDAVKLLARKGGAA